MDLMKEKSSGLSVSRPAKPMSRVSTDGLCIDSGSDPMEESRVSDLESLAKPSTNLNTEHGSRVSSLLERVRKTKSTLASGREDKRPPNPKTEGNLACGDCKKMPKGWITVERGGWIVTSKCCKGSECGKPKDEQNNASTTVDHDANLPTKDPSRAPAQPTKTFRKRRVATNYKPKPKSKTTGKKNETLSVGKPQEGHQSSEPAPEQCATGGIADETLTPDPTTTANGDKTKGGTRRKRKAKSKGTYEEGATRDLTEGASVHLEEEAPTGPTDAQVEMETVSVTPVVSEEVQAVTTTVERTLSFNKVEEDPEPGANSMPVFREEAPDFPYAPSTETSYSGSTLGSTPLFTPRSTVPPIGATTPQDSNLPQTVNYFWPSPYPGATYTPNYYFGPQPFYSPSFVGLRQHPFGTPGTLQNPMISMGNTYGPPPGFTYWNDPQAHSHTHVDLPVSATHVSGLQARQPYSSYQAESGFAHQPPARHPMPPFEPVYPSLNDPLSHFLYDSYQFVYNPIPQS